MQILVEDPSIKLGRQSDEFCGQFSFIKIAKTEIVKPNCKEVYFLRLFGIVKLPTAGSSISVGITESDLGPLFINKGKKGFFIYLDGALRKLMDALGIADVSEFNGKTLPVANSDKGFWIISAKKLLEDV
ncbi:MAG: hypothetical protein AABX74_01755 [Nanoarchaeota archaeon]